MQTVDNDTTAAKTDKQDSVHLFRLPPPKRQKSYNIFMTEYMVKCNLARLSQYAEGRYLNPIFTLDELFIQANEFPEDVKNKMFGFAMAGGLAREVFKLTRQQLNKKNIRFIYPNLYGLNLTYPLPIVPTQLNFRAMSFYDRYYMLNWNQGQIYIYYRETPIVEQRGLDYKLHKQWRLLVQRAQYQDTAYNGFGLSHSTRKVFLYMMYSRNVNFPQYSRTYLYLNVQFDR